MYLRAKRLLDFFFAIALLVLLLPFMAAVAILVLALTGRPVFFMQERGGYKGRVFRICKYRTMREGDGADRERLTGLGRFLRKTSIDELPQLVNIIRGEMSFIGPRPLLKDYLPLYSKEQLARHDVRPGISGWAQIHGRNALSWEEKFKYDLWYVKNVSLWLDLKILLGTALTIFSAKDILPPGKEEVEKFRGSL